MIAYHSKIIFYIFIISFLIFSESCKSIPTCKSEKIRVPVIDTAPEKILIKNEPPVIVIWLDEIDFSIPKSYLRIISAIWEDGTIIWSTNKFSEQPFYYMSNLEKGYHKSINKYIDSSETYKTLKQYSNNFGPDGSYIAIYLSNSNNYLLIRSWHELFERSPKLNDKKDYQDFLFLWKQIRMEIFDITPDKGKSIDVTFTGRFIEKNVCLE